MEELILARDRYEELIHRVEKDIETAEQYKNDMVNRYNNKMQFDVAIAIQSQVLRIQDYITQKFNSKVELLRGLDEIKKAIEEENA